MIKVTNLTKKYGDRVVLDIPLLELERGKAYAIIGANGSGKTTFLKILAGVLVPSSGATNLGAGATQVFMPQKSFAFDISVLNNLLAIKNDKKRALDILSRLELGHLAKRRAGKLSGGETQRLALARLLMSDFNIMLLDEPTFAMDINSALVAEKVIKTVSKEQGATLIFSTHSMPQAARLADEAIFLHNGKICEQTKADIFINKPQSEQAAKFLQYFTK